MKKSGHNYNQIYLQSDFSGKNNATINKLIAKEQKIEQEKVLQSSGVKSIKNKAKQFQLK